MKNQIRLILLLSGVFITGKSFSQLTLTPTTALNAVQNNLLGAGVTVSNITYQGVPNSLAVFSGTSSIGLTNGVFMGTGSSAMVGAPASAFLSDGATAMGDSTLQTLVTSQTQDAAVLEFDFQVASDSVKFNFVFASEEYSDYVNSAFNDVFGFFISGPGITGVQNIALIPGTTTPVTINNVNNGYSSTGVVPTGPCTNCAFYSDNTNGMSVAFDGYTTVLTAISAVQPCTVYHIKLAVANVGDGAFDSGVFLDSNSFQACGPLTVFNGLAPVADTIRICNGSSVQLNSVTAPNYAWSTGASTQSITVSQPGIYAVSVSSGNCNVSSELIVVEMDTTSAKPSLSQNGLQLISSITDTSYTYQWFLDGNPLAGSNTPIWQINTGGCYKVCVTYNAGCILYSDSVCLSFAGISGTETSPEFVVMPNPSSGNITVSFSYSQQDLMVISIFDMTGKKQTEITTENNTQSVSCNNLSKGIYLIETKNSRTGERSRKRFIRL